VTESHQPLTVLELRTDHRISALGCPYFVQHRECTARGSAVKGSRERADRAAHCRRKVRSGRDDHPSREGGRVESVVDRQDHVLLDRAHLLL
jgi:hypothetical protein